MRGFPLRYPPDYSMVATKWKKWAILLVILLTHVTGVLLFCKGYLLSRVEIHEHSQCKPPKQSSPLHQYDLHGHTLPHGGGGGGCNLYSRRFKRVVWLLIDALRYDFAVYDSSLDPSPPHYRNKMPHLRDLVQEHSQHAKLFHFFADPPTTTLQRLKALTTGGLPTFIEVSSNFNSYEVLEDSLLYQIHHQGLNTTFIGDDTWLGLYQQLLSKAFAYPSFNVKDLHTVDNGVISHLIPQLKLEDASLIVGHFLGVDHCGHILGPSHPAMADKLTQMDQVLRSVVAELDNDTILFVFGDHGMTPTGDHGGESGNETDAGLFVYSPRPLFCDRQINNRVVSQIDLVPTTALLLGIPLPFSNLGAIIPELFLPCTSDSPLPHFVEDVGDGDARAVYETRVNLDFLTALHLNAKQVESYLSAYSRVSGEFSSLELRELQRTLSQAELSHAEVATLHERHKYRSDASQVSNLTKMADTASLYVQYLRDVKEMCRQIWAKFDDSLIQQGLCVTFLATAVTFLLTLSNAAGGEPNQQLVVERVCLKHTWSGLLLGLCGSVLYRLATRPFSLSHFQSWLVGAEVLAAGSASGALLGMLYSVRGSLYSVCSQLVRVYHSRSWWTSNLHTLTSFSLVIAYAFSLLSNSFILYEFSVAIFLSQTLTVLSLVSILRTSIVHCGPNWFCSRAPFFRKGAAFVLLTPKGAVLVSIVVMVVNRVSKAFRTCRDLQMDCSLTHYTLSLPAAVEMAGLFSVFRFAVSCISVCGVPLAAAMWCARVRSLGGVQMVFLFLVHPLISVLVCGHWSIQAYAVLYADKPLPHWQHVLLPRLVYLLVFMSVVYSIVKILSAAGRGSGEGSASGGSHRRAHQSAPVQAGLRQRVSCPEQRLGSVEPEELSRAGCSRLPLVEWLQVVLGVWQVLVMLHNDGLALGAILMAVQMAALLLVTVTMCTPPEEAGAPPSTWPTAVYWCVVTALFFHATGHETTIPSIKFDAAFVGLHGEVNSLFTFLVAGLLVGLNTLASQVFHAVALPLPLLMRTLSSKVHKDDFERSTMRFALQLTFCYSIKVSCSLLAASIHRRHMMAWSVFVPRFLYEAAFFAVTEVLILIVWAGIM